MQKDENPHFAGGVLEQGDLRKRQFPKNGLRRVHAPQGPNLNYAIPHLYLSFVVFFCCCFDCGLTSR